MVAQFTQEIIGGQDNSPQCKNISLENFIVKQNSHTCPTLRAARVPRHHTNTVGGKRWTDDIRTVSRSVSALSTVVHCYVGVLSMAVGAVSLPINAAHMFRVALGTVRLENKEYS